MSATERDEAIALLEELRQAGLRVTTEKEKLWILPTSKVTAEQDLKIRRLRDWLYKLVTQTCPKCHEPLKEGESVCDGYVVFAWRACEASGEDHFLERWELIRGGLLAWHVKRFHFGRACEGCALIDAEDYFSGDSRRQRNYKPSCLNDFSYDGLCITCYSAKHGAYNVREIWREGKIAKQIKSDSGAS